MKVGHVRHSLRNLSHPDAHSYIFWLHVSESARAIYQPLSTVRRKSERQSYSLSLANLIRLWNGYSLVIRKIVKSLLIVPGYAATRNPGYFAVGVLNAMLL
jgi:hypothetical protein